MARNKTNARKKQQNHAKNLKSPLPLLCFTIDMEVEIEDASIKFLDQFYEIEKQCFEREAFTKQQIAYLLTDYNAIGLTARINGEIAGFIIGRIDIGKNETS